MARAHYLCRLGSVAQAHDLGLLGPVSPRICAAKDVCCNTHPQAQDLCHSGTVLLKIYVSHDLRLPVSGSVWIRIGVDEDLRCLGLGSMLLNISIAHDLCR